MESPWIFNFHYPGGYHNSKFLSHVRERLVKFKKPANNKRQVRFFDRLIARVIPYFFLIIRRKNVILTHFAKLPLHSIYILVNVIFAI